MITKPLLPLSLTVVSLLLGACSTAAPYSDTGGAAPPPRAFPSSDPIQTQHSTIAASCPVLQNGPADTMMSYSSTKMGLSFQIPYNANWGYSDSKFPAYEFHDANDQNPLGYVSFGAPRLAAIVPEDENCDLTHQYVLRFLPHRSVQSAVHAIEGADSAITPTTTTKVVNGFTVVQYTDAGTCSYPTMEVIGKKYNYEFSTYCGQNTSDEWNYLTNIVQSLKLVQ